MISSHIIRLIGFAAILFVNSHAHAGQVTSIFYSGYFTAAIPTKALEGATFFLSDGPGIKFGPDRNLVGSIITRAEEGFAPDFDLKSYPLYLFGWKKTDNLISEIADTFIRSRAELIASLNNPTFDSMEVPGATIYSACSDRCVAFVVQDDQDEQLLMLTSRGFSATDLANILKGTPHATE